MRAPGSFVLKQSTRKDPQGFNQAARRTFFQEPNGKHSVLRTTNLATRNIEILRCLKVSRTCRRPILMDSPVRYFAGVLAELISFSLLQLVLKKLITLCLFAFASISFGTDGGGSRTNRVMRLAPARGQQKSRTEDEDNIFH